MRFSIRTLLIVIATVAILIWWNDSGFRLLYQETSGTHGSIEIHGRRDRNSDRLQLKLRFFAANSGPKNTRHLSETMLLPESATGLPEFDSVIDRNSGTWCIYDKNQQGFVLIAHPQRAKGVLPDFWYPGLRVGWARGIWAATYKDLRSRNRKLPYVSLPGEYRVIPQ